MFSQLEPLPESEQKKLQQLRKYLKGLNKVCVAYSGGVDSSLVAAIAQEQLGSGAIAVTGVSASLAPSLRNEAQQQAAWMKIHYEECITNEINDPSYRNNPINRCFACKKELHQKLKSIRQVSEGSIIIDGVNFDDIHDHRPGIEAARQAGVCSPLVELKIGKSSIRIISKALGFPWWDKPAQPCLASRFPYGEAITNQGLEKVAKAEEWLRSNGCNVVRVRSQGLVARIELPEEKIQELLVTLERKKIIDYFLSIGFTSVSLDLEGFVSGKLNREIKAK